MLLSNQASKDRRSKNAGTAFELLHSAVSTFHLKLPGLRQLWKERLQRLKAGWRLFSMTRCPAASPMRSATVSFCAGTETCVRTSTDKISFSMSIDAAMELICGCTVCVLVRRSLINCIIPDKVPKIYNSRLPIKKMVRNCTVIRLQSMNALTQYQHKSEFGAVPGWRVPPGPETVVKPSCI